MAQQIGERETVLSSSPPGEVKGVKANSSILTLRLSAVSCLAIALGGYRVPRSTSDVGKKDEKLDLCL